MQIITNNIQTESIRSQKYVLIRDIDHPDLLALTVDNVARVEAMIATDSNYWRSGDINAVPEIKIYTKGSPQHSKGSFEIEYGGSTAYWMNKLKLYINPPMKPMKQVLPQIPKSKNVVEEWEKLFIAMIQQTPQQVTCYKLALTIYGAVSAIDRDNRTHLSSDAKNNSMGNGRIELTKRIFKIAHILLDSLKRRDIKIIEKLSRKTKNGAKGGRENYSFATKFCHYACYYWFEGLPEQDNYSIYDNILCKAVVKYANAHGVYDSLNNGVHFEESDFSNCDQYAKYMAVIDELRTKHGENISRNGFDHLLWYYHKGK